MTNDAYRDLVYSVGPIAWGAKNQNDKGSIETFHSR